MADTGFEITMSLMLGTKVLNPWRTKAYLIKVLVHVFSDIVILSSMPATSVCTSPQWKRA